MSEKKYSKDDVYKAVLNAAIELDIQQGHLKWNYTTLARRSGISRSLIYYYFGKEKINILKEACLLFGEELAGIGDERMNAWKEGRIDIGLNKTRSMFKDYPYLVPFYFLYRTQENEIGDTIKRYENEGYQKRKHFFPELSDSELKVMFSFHLGLATFPGLNEDDVKLACDIIKKQLN
jgi:AcrR family transcriptional regulator